MLPGEAPMNISIMMIKRLGFAIEPISMVLNPVVVEAEITWKTESKALFPNEVENFEPSKKYTGMIPPNIRIPVITNTILL